MTQWQALYHLYTAIIDAMSRSGGPYAVGVPLRAFHDVLDALHTGQYHLELDDDGRVSTFCSWWFVDHKDVDLVERGARPDDITSGSIMFITHCFTLHPGRRKILPMIKSLRQKCAHRIEAALWWRAKAGKPKQPRYFTRTIIRTEECGG